MKSPFTVLILTDHSGHSQENSMYPLAAGYSEHPEVERVLVSSRSIQVHVDLFSSQRTVEFRASEVDPSFTFGLSQYYFTRSSFCHSEMVDVVMIRMPQPLDQGWLKSLKDIFPNSLIINDPNGILLTGSKSFLLDYPELIPPSRHCHSAEDVLDFAANYETVLKPLRGYGGAGIVRIKDGQVDTGRKTIELETYLEEVRDELDQKGMVAMKFLSGVRQGDKRTLVVNGRVMASSLRLPGPDEWVCNVARGGRSVPAETAEEEYAIVEILNPAMRANGIFIYGLDTLVGDQGERVMTEVNTVSVGGFKQAESQTGRPILRDTIDMIIEKAKSVP